MRILLDECLPRKLKHILAGHDVRTVPEIGWAGTKNGALLRLAMQNFDVFITVDQNLQHQQDLSTAQITVILLVAPNNRLATLRPLMIQMLEVLPTAKPGDVIRIAAAHL